MYLPEKDRDLDFVLNSYFAHRGYYENGTDHPENSMEAFKLALDNGFGIEMDLQLTKDNKVVIFHDDDMERMTGIKGRICDHTYKELQQINLVGSNAKIPLFRDFINLVDGKVPLIIEIKTCKETNERLVELLCDMLDKYKGKFCVYSFDPRVVKLVRLARPNYIRGLLTTHFTKKDVKSFFGRLLLNNLYSIEIAKPDFLSSNFDFRPKKYERWHKHAPIIAWTIRSKEQEKEARKYFDNVVFEHYDPRK